MSRLSESLPAHAVYELHRLEHTRKGAVGRWLARCNCGAEFRAPGQASTAQAVQQHIGMASAAAPKRRVAATVQRP